MRQRGKSPRLYPGSLVWCLKKPGRDLRDKVELWLAWKRVNKEVAEGTLGEDFDRADRAEIVTKAADAEEAAKDEVWGGYRFAVLADHQEPDGLKTIDLGAGHSSGSETLCGRVITALKSQALLNESVGAGYIERNWPPALKDTGAWPLASLRQSFLNGSLTRLLDPDARPLRTKDGYICITANTDQQAAGLFEAFGMPELKGDPRFKSVASRAANTREYYSIRERSLQSKTTADWLAIFDHHDVPAMPYEIGLERALSVTTADIVAATRALLEE